MSTVNPVRRVAVWLKGQDPCHLSNPAITGYTNARSFKYTQLTSSDLAVEFFEDPECRYPKFVNYSEIVCASAFEYHPINQPDADPGV